MSTFHSYLPKLELNYMVHLASKVVDPYHLVDLVDQILSYPNDPYK